MDCINLKFSVKFQESEEEQEEMDKDLEPVNQESFLASSPTTTRVDGTTQEEDENSEPTITRKEILEFHKRNKESSPKSEKEMRKNKNPTYTQEEDGYKDNESSGPSIRSEEIWESQESPSAPKSEKKMRKSRNQVSLPAKTRAPVTSRTQNTEKSEKKSISSPRSNFVMMRD